MDIVSISKDYSVDIDRGNREIREYVKEVNNGLVQELLLVKGDINQIKEHMNTLVDGLNSFSEMIEKKEFGTVGSANQVEYFMNAVAESNKTHFNSIYNSLDILLAEVFKMKLAILDEKDKSIFNYKEDFVKMHEAVDIIKATIQSNSDKIVKLEEIVIPVVVEEPVVEIVEEVIEQPVVEEVKPVVVDESMKMLMVDYYKQLKKFKRAEGCKAMVLKKTFLHSAGNYRYLNNKWKKVFDEKLTSDSNCG